MFRAPSKTQVLFAFDSTGNNCTSFLVETKIRNGEDEMQIANMSKGIVIRKGFEGRFIRDHTRRSPSLPAAIT